MPACLSDVQVFDYEKVATPKGNPSVLASVAGYATFTDKPNRNNRIYPKGFWASVLKDNARVDEMIRTKTFFGEAKHPGEGESPIPHLENVSHAIREYEVRDEGVWVVFDVLDTPKGRAIKTLLDYGSKLGVSTRAYGAQKKRASDGLLEPDPSKYLLVTWDFVSFPAFSDARPPALDESANDAEDFDLPTAATWEQQIANMNDADAKAFRSLLGMNDSEEPTETVESLKAQLDEAARRLVDLEESRKDEDAPSQFLRLLSDLQKQPVADVYIDERSAEIDAVMVEKSKIEATLRATVESFEEKLTKANDDLLALQDQYNDSVEEITKISREFEAERLKANRIQDRCISLEQDLTSLQSTNDSLVSDLDGARTQIRDLTVQVSRKGSQNSTDVKTNAFDSEHPLNMLRGYGISDSDKPQKSAGDLASLKLLLSRRT